MHRPGCGFKCYYAITRLFSDSACCKVSMPPTDFDVSLPGLPHFYFSTLSKSPSSSPVTCGGEVAVSGTLAV